MSPRVDVAGDEGRTGAEWTQVVGHSFGGAVALQLALDAPEAVHSLALLEPGLMIGGSAQSYREALVRGAQRHREVGAEVAVDEFLQARWPGYRDYMAKGLADFFAHHPVGKVSGREAVDV